jgi:alpha-tubulin suppressor-like RCC1 family protein
MYNPFAGKYHTIITTSTGIYGTGSNLQGQLGLSDISYQTGFTQIPNIEGTVQSISCGGEHTVISTSTGVYATGNNFNGQLGFGDTSNRNTFTQIPNIQGTVQSISCGGEHTVISTSTGVYATGSNLYGELGLGNNTNRNTFTQIPNIQGTLQFILCGYNHTIIATSTGIYGTGYNANGQLGLGNNTNRNTFTKITIQGTLQFISCGYNHTIIATSTGVYGTGNGLSGQLGFGTNVSRSSFTQITNIQGTVESISCGGAHTIIKTSTGIYGTGHNGFGQLGFGNNTNQNYFTSIPNVQGTLQSISCGEYHTIIATLTGIYVSGRNNYGQLGLGNTTNRNTFTKNNFFVFTTSGSPPEITSIAPLISDTPSINIYYNDSTGGNPANSTYFYKLNGQGDYILAGASPFTISNNISIGGTYYVVMYAYNADWPTPYVASSPSSSVTINNTGSAPSNLIINAISETWVDITFTESSGGFPSPEYYYSLNGGAKITNNDTSSPINISNLNPATTYSIALYAYNANWPEPFSPASPTLTISTYNTGSAPYITSVSPYETSLVVYFNISSGGIPSLTDYYYQLNDGEQIAIGQTTSPITISGLTSGETYNIVLYSYNEFWENLYSLPSNTFSETTLKTGSAPIITTVFPYETGIDLYFTQSSGVPNPTNYYYTLNGSAKVAVGYTTSPISIYGLTSGNVYNIVLYAYNLSWPSVDHFSIASDTISVTTLRTGTAPTNLTSTSYQKRIDVFFTASINGVPSLPTSEPPYGTPAVNGYYYSINSGPKIYGGVSSPISITGLNPNTSYSIKLYAYQEFWPSVDHFSAESATLTASTTLVVSGLSYYFVGLNDITLKFPLITGESNYVPNSKYLTNSGNALSQIMLYSFGTRNTIGFKIDDDDIGQIFQQDSVTNAFELGPYKSPPWNLTQVNMSNSNWIWNSQNATTSAATYQYIWFYYTFYSEVKTTGTLYAGVDDVGTLYLNERQIILQGFNNNFSTSVVVKSGLNYIRVAAYNIVGPAGFIMSIVVNGNQIVNTDSDWVTSLANSNYSSTTLYNDVRGSLSFVVNLNVTGTIPFSPNIANYVSGGPAGVTYSTVTTPGTYTLSSSTSNASNILVTLPSGYIKGTYSGSIVITNVVNLTLSGLINSSMFPVTVSNYIDGFPNGTVFTPATITNSGTYTLSSTTSGGSNIRVTLPAGFVAGTYTGTLVALTSVNLTLSGTIYAYMLPANPADYISGEPAGTIFNPARIVTAGTYSLSSTTSGGYNILVTLPSEHIPGNYTGSLVVNTDLFTATGVSYNKGGTTQFPSINGYNVLYITAGTGTVQFYPGTTIKNIFLVGGGAGGNSSGFPGNGGNVNNNANLSFSGNNTFSISVGSGGSANSSGTATTVACPGLSFNSIAYGGSVSTSLSSSAGTTHPLSNLTYGGGGGIGGKYEYFPTNGNLGGGGGGGGNGQGFVLNNSTGLSGQSGGKSLGISSTLYGGNGGTGRTSYPFSSSGFSSIFGGGGGSGGAKMPKGGSNRIAYNGGNGGTGTGSGTGAIAGTGNGDYGQGGGGGGGGGAGGVNTGGGGGGGGSGGAQLGTAGAGGNGGSGIVIICYQ